MTEKKKTPPRSNRFTARYIWRGHLKGLKNRDFHTDTPVGVPDTLSRVVLYALPVIAGVVCFWSDATVAAVDGLLAAAGILASGLFMAFTQVASWRDRYTERLAKRESAERPQRYALDETVPHILMAAYACFVLALVVLVGANFADDQGRLVGVFSALTVVVGVYVLLLMMIIMPKLYGAYIAMHKVDADISGHSS